MKWFRKELKKCQRCWRVNDAARPFGDNWLCIRHYQELLALMIGQIPYEKEYEPHLCVCCDINLGIRKTDKILYCKKCATHAKAMGWVKEIEDKNELV